MTEDFDPIRLQKALAEMGRNIHLRAVRCKRRQAWKHFEKYQETGCLRSYVAYTAITEEQDRADVWASRFDQALRQAS